MTLEAARAGWKRAAGGGGSTRSVSAKIPGNGWAWRCKHCVTVKHCPTALPCNEHGDLEVSRRHARHVWGTYNAIGKSRRLDVTAASNKRTPAGRGGVLASHRVLDKCKNVYRV